MMGRFFGCESHAKATGGLHALSAVTKGRLRHELSVQDFFPNGVHNRSGTLPFDIVLGELIQGADAQMSLSGGMDLVASPRLLRAERAALPQVAVRRHQYGVLYALDEMQIREQLGWGGFMSLPETFSHMSISSNLSLAFRF